MSNVSVDKNTKITIGISDMAISNNVSDTLITYSLGSCIAVLIYDPTVRVAGMIHVMLPDSSIEKMAKQSLSFNPYKYMDTGVPLLIKKCLALGAKKATMSISVFGGAQVFDREDYFNIGKRNYVALRKVLWQEGLLIRNEHVGGRVHRTVRIDVNSGNILLDVNKEEIITYSSLIR
ncbi:chemotaxis protein CheD [bacterium]|nr:MAG: chemotaxis protein CheD [bacterium]